MYIIRDGKKFIGEDMMRRPTIVTQKSLAVKYRTKQSAENAIKNLPYMTKTQYNWDAVEQNAPEKNQEKQERIESIEVNKNSGTPKTEPSKKAHIKKTPMKTERIASDFKFDDNFDIHKFLCDTLPVLSNLKEFYNSKVDEEDKVNGMILDIRHYLRDNIGKINAIQMQRLGYYQQQLEKEREIAKKSYKIAREILDEPEKLLRWNFTKMVNDMFQTPYKPRVLTYDIISEISNTPRGNLKSSKSA